MKLLVFKIGLVSDHLVKQVKQKLAFSGVDYSVDNLSKSAVKLTDEVFNFVERHGQVWFDASQDEFLNLALVEILKLPVLFLVNEKVSDQLRNKINYWQKQTGKVGVIFEQDNLENETPIDASWVAVGIDTKRGKTPDLGVDTVTPARFKRHLFSLAKRSLKTIILPEGNEARIQQAAMYCAKQGIAKCVLLGDPNEILKIIGEVPNLVVWDSKQLSDKYVNLLYELRKAKGMTMDDAAKQLKSSDTLLATMMLYDEKVDGLVSGAIHTTADTIRPALQIIKTNPEDRIVSSSFVMCLPENVVVFGDCAVNPNPTAEELMTIAVQTAKTAKAFGLEPKIALLSYSTINSGKGPDVDLVIEANNILKEKCPNLVVDGPLQFDAASVQEVAQIKAPGSLVAGKANVYIFPNLVAGNIGYKIAQRYGNLLTIGPILQGLKKPVNDLSRGCTVDDIIYTIAVTAIQAQS